MVKLNNLLTDREAIEMMQDDILALSAEIDAVLDVFEVLRSGGAIPVETIEEIIKSAHEVSDEVVLRWLDAEYEDDEIFDLEYPEIKG